MNSWDDLPIREKAEMMKVAIKNGITSLPDIKDAYNEFAEGGNLFKKGGSKKKPSVNPTARRAMRYFMDKGLTDYQAAGLVGNLMRESGMNPEAVNKSSQAYGLAQWLGPRKKALFAKYGNHPTLNNQLDFIWSELNSTHRNGLKYIKASKNAEEAARNAMGYYEFSVGHAGAIANMKKYGQDGEGSMAKGITFASRLMGHPVPTSYSYSDSPQLSVAETIPQEDFSFTPMNPQVFGMQMPAYQSPVVVPEQPIIAMAEQPTPTPKQLERQRIMQERAEQRDALNRFGLLMSMSNPQQGNDMMGAIDMLAGLSNGYRSGGDIYIKPSHRGRFTRLKERTGHSASWFKEHGNPAQKKMATFALNAAKWKHGYGGNLYNGITESTQQMQTGKDYWAQLANKPTWLDTFITPINGGQLSEVVVKPTNDESWLFSLGRYARNSRKPLADSYTRKVVANYLSKFDNESAKDYNSRISRLADTLDIRGVQFIKNNVESGKLKNRAHYDSKSNTAYIDDMQDIFAEVAHPWQDAIGNNSMNDEFKKRNYDPDIDSRGGTRYAYPDTFEGETHGFFQPALTEWVETGKIGRSLPLLNEDLSNEKIVPKDNIEVLDSAASWNKQAIDKRVIANPHQLPLTKRIQYSIWDYPLLNKKRALGGNLYDGTSQPTQQMDNSYTYYKPLENIFVDSDGNLRDPEVPRARGSILLPEVTAAYPDLKDMAGRYNIVSNDAITVANGRPVNMHLRKAVEEGAAKQAAWAQEHPYINMVGIAAGAAPLAVAAAPVVVGSGELTATALANPYVDAGITSAFAGHGLNHAINEGIDGWGDAAMTALEVMPLGRLAKPTINSVTNVAKNLYDNGTLWDAYTTFNGRLGNYGDNLLTNIYGTAARRFGFPDKARMPADAIRKISDSPKIANDFIDLTGNKNWLGNPHINLSIDRPVVSHPNGGWDGADTYLFPFKDYLKETAGALKSIEPSDVFSNGVAFMESPSKVTLISGDTKALKEAQKAGMQTLSSPRLRRLYSKAEQNYNSNRLLNKHPKKEWYWKDYATEVQRLQSQRGTPTIADFNLLEEKTGLNSGVAPLYEYDNALNGLRGMQKLFNTPGGIRAIMNGEVFPYIYPNGREVEWSIQGVQDELNALQRAKYNKVFYDPTSHVESDWRSLNR